MTYRRLTLAAGASAVMLLSASPAFAAWPASGVGRAAAKGGTVGTISVTGIGMACGNPGRQINLTLTVSGVIPTGANIDISRTTVANTTNFATPLAANLASSTTSYSDTTEVHSTPYYYAARLQTANWVSATTVTTAAITC